MKRYGKLFGLIADEANLDLALENAARHKNWQRKVQNVRKNWGTLRSRLLEDLRSGRFKTSEYRTKWIYEPKERKIYILPFYPDRILHHAIMNVLQPIWDGLMFYHSYACRFGKGQHAGSLKCMEYVRKKKYVLKCDISKFYPSVDHLILKALLRKKIKDERVLTLLDSIIDSAEGGKNVPIGNFLSQWFGNLYLNELDDFIKHKLKCKLYLRYCDDFCLFSDDKTELRRWADEIKKFLDAHLLLRMSKCNVFPTSHGVDFLGYRHFQCGKILVRKRTAKRMKRNARTIMARVRAGRLSKSRALSTVGSINGWLRHANTHNLLVSLELDKIKTELEKME